MFCSFNCERLELIPITAESINKHISSFKGEKAVLLNIWALWCIPCKEEFPMIVKLDNEIKDLEVVFISADFEDQIEGVIDFLSNYEVGNKSYIKDEKDEPFIIGINQNWTGSLPFTIIYSKKSGSVIDLWEGKKSESKFKSAINIAINS
ncbi:MAG: TlpA family protein disulfide reductase [Candidatus Neomarinimicrobiota bacterium]